MKKCKIKGCEREVLSVKVCSMHYQRKDRTGEYGEAETRRNGYGELGIDWSDEEAKKEYYRDYSKIYMRKYGHKYKSINAMHKMRFGGNRDKVLERDNHTCQGCGMTDEEHTERWGCHITVDHINGKGRDSKEKDHSMDNLQVLCITCHGKKDGVGLGVGFRSNRNTSGFRGVTFNKEHKRWRANISIDGKPKYLGYFSTKEEASVVYENKLKELQEN